MTNQTIARRIEAESLAFEAYIRVGWYKITPNEQGLLAQGTRSGLIKELNTPKLGSLANLI